MGEVVIPDNLKIYQGKKILITGDTGFKGSWLSFWLDMVGAKVCGVALPSESPDDLFNRLELDKKIDHYDVDIRDLESLKTVFNNFKPEFVFHLAAQSLVRPSYDDPKNTFDTNVGGSLNVLECVRQSSSVKSVIYVTTDKCYKNKEWERGYHEEDELGGHDPYSASKAAAEILFNSYLSSYFYKKDKLGISSVRAGNVIGGGDWAKDRIVPDCIRSLKNNETIPVRNKIATRPWQHVLDPLYGYLVLGAKQRNSFEISGNWNFGPDKSSNKTVEELVKVSISEWESGSYEDMSDPDAVHEATLLHLDCEKAKSQLSWTPVWNFEKTMHFTISWYKRFLNNESAKDITINHIEEFMKDIK